MEASKKLKTFLDSLTPDETKVVFGILWDAFDRADTVIPARSPLGNMRAMGTTEWDLLVVAAKVAGGFAGWIAGSGSVGSMPIGEIVGDALK